MDTKGWYYEKGKYVVPELTKYGFDTKFNGIFTWGNSKIGKSVACLSITPGPPSIGGSCLNCEDCWINVTRLHDLIVEERRTGRKACYIEKAVLNPKTKSVVAHMYKRNSVLFHNMPETAIGICIDQISRKKSVDGIRWHVSGDFDTVEYIECAKKVAKAFPELPFWSYTKCYHLDSNPELVRALNELDSLDNFNVVDSCPEGYTRNFFPEEEINDVRIALTSTTHKACAICPCRPGKKVKCGTECTICQGVRYCIFVQH